jgi:Flp pilus assembly pilin Flp
VAQTTSARELKLHLVAARDRGHDEQAQTLAEYAVILTVITVAVIAAIALLATTLGVHIDAVARLIP